MTSEKALRLVTERRVVVLWASDDAAQGTVDGETDTYQVSYSPAGRVCTCLAAQHHRVCSHAIALELEVMRQREGIELADNLETEIVKRMVGL